MKIVVDADACPVKEIIVKYARQKNIAVTMVIDNSHILNDGYSTVITVDTGKDEADLRLINLTESGDIVITQDYGVASLALAKKALALNQNGLIFTSDNIDMLMMSRYEKAKQRKHGHYSGSSPKRTRQNNMDFEKAFLSLL